MPDSPTSENESDFVCDSGDKMRSACVGEPFYREHEGKRYCVLHYPGKDKAALFDEVIKRKLAESDFDFRGVWFPGEISFSEFEFSTDVDFSFAFFSAETNFISAIFHAVTNFRSATFTAPTYFSSIELRAAVYFSSANFSAAAYFNGAEFRAGVDFSSAVFRSRVNFSYCTFHGVADFSAVSVKSHAYFNSSTFNAVADFRSVTLDSYAAFRTAEFKADAYFDSAVFGAEMTFLKSKFQALASFRDSVFSGQADFRNVNFSAKADFGGAVFGDYMRFSTADEEGNGNLELASLNLQFAKIEQPDRVSFRTVSLRPHWFVNVDARRLDFINVKWDSGGINQELQSLENERVASPHRMLSIACRHLAVNAEENHRYEEASKFRYMAMDTRRRELWHGFAFWRLSWWYWLASGYGERAWQATLMLVGLWFLFACIFFIGQGSSQWWQPKPVQQTPSAETTRQVADNSPRRLEFREALIYSAGVITLQKPDPAPGNKRAKTMVLLEMVLGPIQGALLALAIRRKFMR